MALAPLAPKVAAKPKPLPPLVPYTVKVYLGLGPNQYTLKPPFYPKSIEYYSRGSDPNNHQWGNGEPDEP